MTSKYTNQVAFRGRNDSHTLNDTSFEYNQNANFSYPVDTVLRVRLEVEETNSKNSSESGQLEYRHYTTSWSGWSNVTGSSSVIQGASSGSFSDDDSTTNVLTGSARTFTGGNGTFDGLPGSPTSINNSHLENEYVLTIVSADVANGDLIEVRIAGLDNWAQTPQITVIESSATEESIVGGLEQDESIALAQYIDAPASVATEQDEAIAYVQNIIAENLVELTQEEAVTLLDQLDANQPLPDLVYDLAIALSDDVSKEDSIIGGLTLSQAITILYDLEPLLSSITTEESHTVQVIASRITEAAQTLSLSHALTVSQYKIVEETLYDTA